MWTVDVTLERANTDEFAEMIMWLQHNVGRGSDGINLWSATMTAWGKVSIGFHRQVDAATFRLHFG